MKISCGIVSGRLVAFDEDLGVCFNVSRRGRTVFYTGKVTVSAKSADGKVQWSLPPGDMNVDDLVVTADAVYCVGHYEGGGRPAELRVISRRDGKVLATYMRLTDSPRITACPQPAKSCSSAPATAGLSVLKASRLHRAAFRPRRPGRRHDSSLSRHRPAPASRHLAGTYAGGYSAIHASPWATQPHSGLPGRRRSSGPGSAYNGACSITSKT